jgi:hypothetical protein
LKNPEKIIEGWYNDARFEKGDLEDHLMAEIIRRRAICAECSFNSKFFPPTERNDEHCTCCGCPIVKKTASFESSCGLEDHNKNNPDDQKELKWTWYDKNQHDDER